MDYAALEAEALELFDGFPLSVQRAVARGELTPAEALEALTDTEMCPRCAQREATHASGFCDVCIRDIRNDICHGKISEEAAQREANRLKQQLKRIREELGTNPRISRRAPSQKTSVDYGRAADLITTNEPLPLAYCLGCGRTIRQHTDDQLMCVKCEDVTARVASRTRARRAE